jgi:ubiquinone/menaquinone biosynthesis C-methylase UbiE
MQKPTVDDWHAQFVRQAEWTQGMRSQLYRRAKLMQAARVLDVGAGTGAITQEISRRTRGKVIGVDMEPRFVDFARERSDGAQYELADALDLPYPDQHFDITLCHFLLLWVADPQRATNEMARVTKEGGTVLICAEPDYGGRIDWPKLPIREWQLAGLARQGADPRIGRQLRKLTAQAHLRATTGIYPAQWSIQTLHEQFEDEWAWLQHDVAGLIDRDTFLQAKDRAKSAIAAGTRFYYVPIFYAWARKGQR